MKSQESIIAVKNFQGKYFINEAYRSIAQALVEKYPELKHIAVNGILFIENTEDMKKKNNTIVFGQIGLVPGKWNEIIYQMIGRNFFYMIEIFKINTSVMSREQLIALIYHELKHIGKDGKLESHDIEDWINMIEKLGGSWNSTRASIPNILDDGVDWDSITGPTALFPVQLSLRVVK